MRKLKPYQQIVFEELKEKDRAGLFLQMRLGKTVISVKWVAYKKAKRILVLCPKSVMPGWIEELYEEGYRKNNFSLVAGPTEQKYEELKVNHFGTHFYVTNHETVTHCVECLKLPWDCIIIDESTKIRNPKADITNYVNNNTDHVKYKLNLSGLPNPESSKDFVEQMRFLQRDFMNTKNFWVWREKYCLQGRFGWDITVQGEKKLMEEVKKLSIFLSRKDAGIGEEKIYEKRYTYMDKAQKKAYEEMMNDFETTLKDELVTTKFVGPKYEYMSQIASGVTPEGRVFSDKKFLELIDLLTGELKKEAVVVWFRHNHEIECAEKYLKTYKIKYAIFTGGRKEREEEFKAGKVRIILAQPKCAQFGMNWSISSTAIYFSNWWDGEVRAQTEDRIVHIDKKEPLLFIDMICKGTIEEDIVEILKEKKAGSELFLKQLTECVKKRIEKWNLKKLKEFVRS